jgi:hypothetical protein
MRRVEQGGVFLMGGESGRASSGKRHTQARVRTHTNARTRAGHDGRAVLVVVEHRDAHAPLALALDVEALGRLDVLEVDAAKRGLERDDDVDELWVVFVCLCVCGLGVGVCWWGLFGVGT